MPQNAKTKTLKTFGGGGRQNRNTIMLDFLKFSTEINFWSKSGQETFSLQISITYQHDEVATRKKNYQIISFDLKKHKNTSIYAARHWGDDCDTQHMHRVSFC